MYIHTYINITYRDIHGYVQLSMIYIYGTEETPYDVSSRDRRWYAGR